MSTRPAKSGCCPPSGKPDDVQTSRPHPNPATRRGQALLHLQTANVSLEAAAASLGPDDAGADLLVDLANIHDQVRAALGEE